jgi:hypothetical protein
LTENALAFFVFTAPPITIDLVEQDQEPEQDQDPVEVGEFTVDQILRMTGEEMANLNRDSLKLYLKKLKPDFPLNSKKGQATLLKELKEAVRSANAAAIH